MPSRTGLVGLTLPEGPDAGAGDVDDGRPALRLYDPLLREDPLCEAPLCEGPLWEEPLREELECDDPLCDDPLCDDPLCEADEGLLGDELLLLLLS